jgi:hypothetical protein
LKTSAPDYPPSTLPKIKDYDDLHAIDDPIVAAMAVCKATEKRDWGYWVKIRGVLLRTNSEEEFNRRFMQCVAKVYGETRCGELHNAAASLNVYLRKTFNLGSAL